MKCCNGSFTGAGNYCMDGLELLLKAAILLEGFCNAMMKAYQEKEVAPAALCEDWKRFGGNSPSRVIKWKVELNSKSSFL
jgi:hypothetical protein